MLRSETIDSVLDERSVLDLSVPDRSRFRQAVPGASFERFRTRVSLLSRSCGVLVGATTVGSIVALAHVGLVRIGGAVTALSIASCCVLGAIVSGVLASNSVVLASRYWLGYRLVRRRRQIERTLPAVVRYLGVLADGIGDHERRFAAAASVPAHGASGDELQRVVAHTRLSGSFDRAIRRVARETPSDDRLGPFLLKYIEHARQSDRSLSAFLGVEARMQTHRQEQYRQRAVDTMELVAELFVVLLVLPAVLTIVLIVASLISPSLSTPVWTPIGPTSPLVVVSYATAGIIVAVGGGTAALITALQPPGIRPPTYDVPSGPSAILESVHSNPHSTALLAVPLAVPISAIGWLGTQSVLDTVVLTVVVTGVPVGAVSIRRRRRDTNKDRALSSFIHAVAGQVRLGTPLAAAVERVGVEIDHGPLQTDIDRLAMRLQFRSTPTEGSMVRTDALDRFVTEVDTALAAQTVGLLRDAISAGSDPDTVLRTLQTEVGRLYQEKRALRSTMAVYTIIGWTTALLIVAIMAIVSHQVFASFATIGAVGPPTGPSGVQIGTFDLERSRSLSYLVTQATMISCGWFAGGTTGDRYEAVFHIAILLGVGFVVFTVVGLR